MTTLEVGLVGEASRTVTSALTARTLGSGDLDVFGTPALLALIEEAACRALDGVLSDDQTHVGVEVTLSHLAPSKVGNTVRGVATLSSVEGKKVRFACEAFDGDTLIGRADHLRVIAPRARFA